MDYKERETQVELFRKPLADGGARYMICTDAAAEGIKLQFCWLMANYDFPWNPARLEQRMGRVHRYGQKHDPVIILNFVAGPTREGRVMKTVFKGVAFLNNTERQGFEPWRPAKAYLFSRQARSTTLAPLQTAHFTP